MSERALPRLPRLKDEPRPPRLARLDKPTVFGLGPDFAQLRKATGFVAGPGERPPGFPGTLDEWYFYFGMAKALNDPPDYRTPPGNRFYGGVDWGYQIPVGGAYVRAPGSAVPDFVSYGTRGLHRVAIRIVTPYFHEGKGAQVQGYDQLQLMDIERNGYTVIDVFSSDYMRDPTGAAAVIAAKQAVGLTQRTSTIRTRRSTARG